MIILSLRNASVILNGKIILNLVNFDLSEGDSMAIVGPSGSGKTTLGRLIAGWYSSATGEVLIRNNRTCRMVEQQDNFIAASHLRSGYYSQRYENLGLEDVPTVEQYLFQISTIENPGQRFVDIRNSLQKMDMLPLARRKLLLLSNGERKRIQLAAVLLQNPDILVLDQPFTGLDGSARQKLEELIFQLRKSGKTIILICDSRHVPEQIDRVLILEKASVSQFVARNEYVPPDPEKNETGTIENFLEKMRPTAPDPFEFAVVMKDIRVRMEDQDILKNINWSVRKGERWALTGPNGSGKTTLLSLITADNPQAYGNDLVLFDRKRGSGESIWDIKKRIGFVSPELHLYFLRGKGIFNSIPGLDHPVGFSGSSISCEEVISSGFHDLIGFSDNPGGFHKQKVKAWFSMLQLGHLSKSRFHEASLSEQRLLLLARALVKMPSLLILDEPCQGLDPHQTRLFTALLDVICSHFETTMIYVTHYPEEIPKSVQYLLELENGQVKKESGFRTGKSTSG